MTTIIIPKRQRQQRGGAGAGGGGGGGGAAPDAAVFHGSVHHVERRGARRGRGALSPLALPAPYLPPLLPLPTLNARSWQEAPTSIYGSGHVVKTAVPVVRRAQLF